MSGVTGLARYRNTGYRDRTGTVGNTGRETFLLLSKTVPILRGHKKNRNCHCENIPASLGTTIFPRLFKSFPAAEKLKGAGTGSWKEREASVLDLSLSEPEPRTANRPLFEVSEESENRPDATPEWECKRPRAA